MVTPEDLTTAAQPVVQLWREDELQVLHALGKAARAKIYDDDDDFLDYLIFEQIYADRKKSTVKVKTAFDRIAELLPISEVKDGVRIITDLYETVQHDFMRYSQTAHTGAIRTYQTCMTDALADVDAIGREAVLHDVLDVIADTYAPVEELTADGVRHSSMSSIAERTIITGMNRAVAEVEIQAARELSGGLIEVSAHHGARPTHQLWQGKVYAVDGPKKIGRVIYPDFVTSTGYGTGAGLCGWNCRHSFWHFSGARSYTDAQLERMRTASAVIDGQTYTEYELTQKERYYNRQAKKYENRYMTKAGASITDYDSLERMHLARRKQRLIQQTIDSIRN